MIGEYFISVNVKAYPNTDYYAVKSTKRANHIMLESNALFADHFTMSEVGNTIAYIKSRYHGSNIERINLIECVSRQIVPLEMRKIYNDA